MSGQEDLADLRFPIANWTSLPKLSCFSNRQSAIGNTFNITSSLMAEISVCVSA